MNELVWMADLKTSTGTIRAEFTDCQQFQCSDRAVMDAYNDALLFEQTEVRPINAAFGSVLVESSNSTSVASFVYSVLLNANPDLQVVLDRVEAAGGKVLMPKTKIEMQDAGHCAMISDTEGNTVGLHSQS